MKLHAETISDSMALIAKSVYEKLDSRYYLAGGTALALLIGHRKSIDLDYFINDSIDTERLKSQLGEIFGAFEVVFQEKDTLWVNIGGVKVSFIARRVPLIEAVIDQENFRLASLKDITAMKLAAICMRDEYKDYFDLACLSSVTDVRSWNSWWQELSPNSDPISWMVALSAVDKVLLVPLDVLEGFSKVDTTETIKKATREIAKFA
ncbi:MAG: nucleotidyl transferase AbiEii/AbiGii toxin family protein [Candidatus Gracilibacteria bacterium]|jgi:predicted nucleotidyltransferase component of viral defense system